MFVGVEFNPDDRDGLMRRNWSVETSLSIAVSMQLLLPLPPPPPPIIYQINFNCDFLLVSISSIFQPSQFGFWVNGTWPIRTRKGIAPIGILKNPEES